MSENISSERLREIKESEFIRLLESGGFVINGEFFPLSSDKVSDIPKEYENGYIRTLYNTLDPTSLTTARRLVTENERFENTLVIAGFNKFYFIPPRLIDNLEEISNVVDGKNFVSVRYKKINDLESNQERDFSMILHNICMSINGRQENKKTVMSTFSLIPAIILKIKGNTPTS